jgi:hypothetical protein
VKSTSSIPTAIVCGSESLRRVDAIGCRLESLAAV